MLLCHTASSLFAATGGGIMVRAFAELALMRGSASSYRFAG